MVIAAVAWDGLLPGSYKVLSEMLANELVLAVAFAVEDVLPVQCAVNGLDFAIVLELLAGELQVLRHNDFITKPPRVQDGITSDSAWPPQSMTVQECFRILIPTVSLIWFPEHVSNLSDSRLTIEAA